MDGPRTLTGDELAALLLALPAEQRAKLVAFDYDGLLVAADGVSDEGTYLEIDGGCELDATTGKLMNRGY